MKTVKNLLLLTLILATFQSCRTIREIKNFAKSEFRIQNIDKMNLGQVDLKNVQGFSDLGLKDAAQLGLALKNKNLPLNLTYIIEVRNPNDKTAALEKLDWVLELDQTDILNGTSNDRIEVAPNGGTASFPISMGLNAAELLNKESLNSMINLLSAIKGDNQEQSRLRLKVKPRFKIAGMTMSLGYIKVGKTFEASKEEVK
jgi:LEA14-like dessication related protein